MYLTTEAIAATLRQVAALAPGSTLATSFMLPLELADRGDPSALEFAVKGAAASGTPFISLFTPKEMLAEDLARRCFEGRADGLRPPGNAEELLVANT